MKKSVLLISLIILFIFSACAKKYDEYTMHKASNVSKRLDSLKTNHLEKQLKKNIKDIKKDNYIILNQSYDLETLILKLSKIDNNIYYLKNYKDYIIPMSNVKIYNLRDLQNYLNDIADLKIEVLKNKFKKKLPKILKISSNSKNKLSLNEIEISLGIDSTLIDLVNYINDNTRFSVFIDKNSFKKNQILNENNNRLTENENYSNTFEPNVNTIEISDELKLNYKLNIKNWKMSKLIKYLQYSLNLYVDIDYEKNIILISKYKIATFDLYLPNIKMKYKNENNTLSTISVSNDDKTEDETLTSSNNLETDVSDEIYSSLKSNIEFILNNFNENANVKINSSLGILTVKTSFLSLQKINKLITKFNNDFNKQLVLEVSFYDIILSKEHTLGIDFARKDSSGVNYKNRFIKNNFLFKDVKEGKWATFFDSLHELGYIYNLEKYDILLTNNVPFEDKDLINTKYIGSKKTTLNVNNGTTTTLEEYTKDDYTEGYKITYFPKINKNKYAFIKLNISQKILENLKVEEYGQNNDTLTLPSIRDVIKSPLLRLKEGEGSIVWQRKYLDVADNYKGIVPIEDFIIGGTSGKKFVLKEYLMLVKLKEIK